ncbi:hypothetical protein RZS08_52905, partial [Arthrospira platensis SPKY1]|nr:hypothetical protein [Arthrospira platensis SPKY1]
SVAAGPITITFTCDGTIDDISVSPTPPRAVNNTITFSADELNQTFTVSIDYTPSSAESAASGGGPLETPTKQPKFKPVTSCPS